MMSTRTMWLGLVVTMALGVATTAMAQPFAYVPGVRPGSNNRGPQFLTVIDVARRAKVARIALGESCLCVGERAACVTGRQPHLRVELLEQHRLGGRHGHQHRRPDVRGAAVSGRAGGESRRYAALRQHRPLPQPGIPGTGARHRVRRDHREHSPQRPAERLGNGHHSRRQPVVCDESGAERIQRQGHRHGH